MKSDKENKNEGAERMALRIKRIYEPSSADDGMRILVDRLWPRGVSKDKAQLTQWMKEVTPSPALRTWFNHQPERFAAFAVRYEAELSAADVQPYLLQLKAWSQSETVTLLYAAKHPQINHAIILKQYIDRMQLPHLDKT